MLPTEVGGSALGPRTLAVVIATFAEADASAAMVYLMPLCATQRSRRPFGCHGRGDAKGHFGRKTSEPPWHSAKPDRAAISGRLSRERSATARQRVSHCQKSWVTSAVTCKSYVVSALAPEARSPTDSDPLFSSPVVRQTVGRRPWERSWDARQRFAPMILEDCESRPGLQLDRRRCQGSRRCWRSCFRIQTRNISGRTLGLCRAAVAGTAAHLSGARFEHLGQTLGESLPTLRAQLATIADRD